MTEVPGLESRRKADGAWIAGLVVAVLGMLGASFGAVGIPAFGLGLVGGALSALGAFWLLKAHRRMVLGPAVALLASLLTVVVGGRSKEGALLRLGAGAPRYVPNDGLGLDGTGAGTVGAGVELMTHPGPFSLSGSGLASLAPDQVVPGATVAAEWENAWFLGRIISVSADKARVDLMGWEPEWDLDLPLAALRAVPRGAEARLGSVVPANVLGSRTPLPNAMILRAYQPQNGLSPEADLGALTPEATLYAQRLDVTNAPLATALPGILAGKPLALVANGAFRLAATGKLHFGLSADGATKLWVDDQPVTGAPIELAAGVHDLKVELRHSGGPTLSLGFKFGTDPRKLRALDMARDGVTQAAREPDGSTRYVLAEGILFELDSDVLNASAERALGNLFATSIAPFPAAAVRVEGHTDDQGADQYNLELSVRRADRVRTWLVDHGRQAPTVTRIGYGEQRPRFPNDGEAHRHANRRVELVVSAAAFVPAAAPSAPASGVDAGAGVPAAPQSVVGVVEAYYRDLNGGTFDADRYFEPRVERFITMVNTTTLAMNQYIRHSFPKQFKKHHFALEPGSFKQEGPGQYLYIEQSRYTLAGQTQPVDKRVNVRIRLSPGGKIVFFQQFQVLR